MSYQVIARKWRPQTFEEVIGQEVVTQTLRNALKYDRLHHAYLFSGARGVGKTTTARLLAKALNCHKTSVPNLDPCLLTDPDACASCVEISESRSIDVLEIDAASHTGIDDVRETILDNINFNPARDRYKVFIIDEVHQLSKPAFNALLKTLEEPPENVVFVMATTELHKVPETILSRCQEFEFRTIPLQKILDRLKFIAEAEKLDISEDALRELARSGDGSMRDAQSNFDQVISFSGESISASDVTHALGLAGVDVLKGITEALTKRDAKKMLTIVDDLTARGHDLRSFCRDLLALFRDLTVVKVAGAEQDLLESSALASGELSEIAAGFSQSDLLRFFSSLCETETKLKEATQSRYVLEIGLMKLIEMRRVESIETILDHLNTIQDMSGNTPVRSVAAGNDAETGLAALQEKKTLNPDVSGEVAPPKEHDQAAEPTDDTLDPAPLEITEPEPYHPPQPPAPVPVRLSQISAEQLEHYDDDTLDNAYESVLLRNGDDIAPLLSMATWADSLPGTASPMAAQMGAARSNGTSTAAARAPAPDPIALRKEIVESTADLPDLADDATEEQMLAYANAHPLVRRAAKVFRAKIVAVKKA